MQKLFFRKALHKAKRSGQELNFGRPPLGHPIKTNFITFQTVYLNICPILIFYKRA